jgi:hypothetical protein
MILALDIATTMGWAIGEPGGDPLSGSIRFGGDGASLWARYHHAFKWAIDRFCPGNGGPRISRLTIEDQLNPQAFSSKEGAELLFGLPAVVGMVAYECGIYDIHRRKVADVRGLFIGKRGLKTDAAKAAVTRRCNKLGWWPQDHNAADALALWTYECSLVEPGPVLRMLARSGA